VKEKKKNTKVRQVSPRTYRILEMVPGLLSWSIILFPIWGSFFIPKAVAYFTISFLVYWFYQSLKTSFLGIKGYKLIQKETRIDWFKKYKTEKKDNWLDWKKIKHIIFIPNYNESAEKIGTNLQALANQKQIDKKQLIIVLAMEERFKGAKDKAKKLVSKFKGEFGDLLVTYHPPDIQGEVIGKASNEAWAGKWVKKEIIDKRGWDINYLTATSCDADARFNSRYFASLTYHFVKNPNRYFRFWQSPIFWHNNPNQIPAPVRIIGILGNVAHIADIQQPDGLFFNYSAYTLSFKLLDNIGYWDTNIIPEDWHVFLQAFFHQHGKVTVEPLFTPTSIDAPGGINFWDALKNRYLQCQRHAWGATDIPYAISQAVTHQEIPLSVRVFRVYKVIKTHLVWSTNWFILTLGASLPAFLNPKFFQTSLGYNLPRFSQIVLTICLSFLFVVIALDMRLRPKEVKIKGFKGWLIHWGQWIIMPIATLFMAVLPALDAQTKLMRGKRLEYFVTPKGDK